MGIGLLHLKHIFRSELRAGLPDVMALWYTIHQQAHVLGYLEAILRRVTAAAEGTAWFPLEPLLFERGAKYAGSTWRV